MPRYAPYVVEQDGGVEKHYDIYTRLLKDRIIFLDGEVNEDSASSVIAQLLFLASEDAEKDVSLYINSYGGSVDEGLAIYDTMNFIPCDVRTYCLGKAMSMGAFLLSSGAKGKRFVLPHASIMIHQVLGGCQGQATDVLIHAKEIERTKETLNRLLAENCGKPYLEVLYFCD